MKLKLLVMLLILALLLTACGYIVVENPETRSLGALMPSAALAEGEGVETEEVALLLGDSGEGVKMLQQTLRRLGFMSGKADGIFGSVTESAVKTAQTYRHEKDEEAKEKARQNRLALLKALSELHAERLGALGAQVPGSDIDMSGFTTDLSETETEPEFRADGVADEALLSYLSGECGACEGTLSSGSQGSDVRRLQTRLKTNNYLFGSVDGSYGAGTKEAVKYFQRLNGLTETGDADLETQNVLFSEACKVAEYPVYKYRVEVSVSKQRVYVYEWSYGDYTKLVKTMKCTTGAVDTPTPLGSFRMGGPCGRWYYFGKYDCWAQYAYRITGGILFHSVLYSDKNESTLRYGSVSNLGSRGSHGCVRLAVDDAKWIYNNIPAGTTCRVYN